MRTTSLVAFSLLSLEHSTPSHRVIPIPNESNNLTWNAFVYETHDLGNDLAINSAQTQPSFHTNGNESYSLPEPEIPFEWTTKVQKRFNALAAKEALGTISKGEAREMQVLSKGRRQLLPGSDPEVILRRHHEKVMVDELLEVLAKYVKFRDGAN